MRPPRRRRRPARPGDPSVRPSAAPIVVGVCWYRQEQYERFLASAADREKLEQTWAEWQMSAERTLRQVRAQGLDVRKVDIDLDELLAYCMAEEKPNTGATRVEYVTHLLEREGGGPA